MPGDIVHDIPELLVRFSILLDEKLILLVSFGVRVILASMVHHIT